MVWPLTAASLLGGDGHLQAGILPQYLPMLISQHQSSEPKAFSGAGSFKVNKVSICTQKQATEEMRAGSGDYFCSKKAVDRAVFSAGKLEKWTLIALFE